MTNAQQAAIRNGVKYALAIAGAVATVAFSAGFARRELDSKEDADAHAVDVRYLKDAIREESGARALQQVRDSAQMSVVLDRLNDIACLQNPNRRYCR